MADNQGDTLDVASYTAPVGSSATSRPATASTITMPPVPTADTVSPSQQAVSNRIGGAPSTTPIITDGNTVNVGNILGDYISQFLDSNRQLIAGGDFGQGAAFSQLMQGFRAQSTALQDKASIDFATARRVQALDNADRARFGIIGDGGSGTLANLATAVTTNERLRQGLAANVQKELSVRFDEDPVGWLMKQFTLPGDIQELSRAEEGVAQNLSVMKGLQELMDSRHRDNLIAAQDTSISAELNARAQVAASSQIELSKVAVEAAKNQLNVANIRSVTLNNSVTALREANNTQNANTANALNYQHLSNQDYELQLNAVRIQQQQQINDLNIAEKEKAQAAEVKLQTNIDAAIRLGTVPVGTDVKSLSLLPTKQREFVLEMSAQAAAGGGPYGYNIADSIEKAGKSPFPLPIGTAQLLERLGPYINQVIAAAPGGEFAFKSLTPQAQNIYLNEGLKAKLNTELKAGIPDENGVFSPGSVLSVAAIPTLKDNPVMQKLSVMAAGNQTYALKAQDAFAAAATMINSKQLSIDQAAQYISDIYQKVTLDNGTRFMYNRLGIPNLDDGSGFNVSLSTGTVFGSSITTNAASPIAARDALTRLVLGGTMDPYTAAAMGAIP